MTVFFIHFLCNTLLTYYCYYFFPTITFFVLLYCHYYYYYYCYCLFIYLFIIYLLSLLLLLPLLLLLLLLYYIILSFQFCVSVMTLLMFSSKYIFFVEVSLACKSQVIWYANHKWSDMQITDVQDLRSNTWELVLFRMHFSKNVCLKV